MVSILLISIGITFIILGIAVFSEKLRLLKNGVKIDGEVIDFEKKYESNINSSKQIVYETKYKPVIRFKTDSGEFKTIIYEDLGTDKKYRIGDKVTLIYPIDDLESIEVNEKQNMFRMLCKLISIGIMFIIFAIVLSLI